jgi:hypothetical protein
MILLGISLLPVDLGFWLPGRRDIRKVLRLGEFGAYIEHRRAIPVKIGRTGLTKRPFPSPDGNQELLSALPAGQELAVIGHGCLLSRS